MNDDKQLTIHFNNGQKLELSFPTQIKNSPGAVLEGMKKNMEADKLAIEAEGRLIVIPWASVQQLEFSPVPPPASLPFGVIKNAKVIE
jgi:hypothetical protein